MSWWTSMRRRKVVQWGLLYAAGAWGFLQGLEYASESFHWPDHLRQVAILAVLIGLPIVLVLAWYHGDRGQQRVSGTELAVVTLLFLLGGAIFWQYDRTHEIDADDVAANTEKPPATPVDSRPSIAVLPFENRSRLEDDAFFVDGIHDDILTQLSKVSAIRVISRTSVLRFRKTDLSVQQIAQQLGVDSILEGGVQRAGDRVRINVQLIDAATDAHRWAETYDRELSTANIFAIQSELAAAIAGALHTALSPAEKSRVGAIPTASLEAWEAYHLAKQHMARRTSIDLAEAERLFRKAIELDAKFALAHVGLADTRVLQVHYAGAPLNSTLADVDQMLAGALKLDPGLAEAWTSSANVADLRGQHGPSERMYERAIGLNPNYSVARHWYSTMLASAGRVDEAAEQAQHAVELDPLSYVIRTNLGAIRELQGNFAEAEANYRKAIAIDPALPGPYIELALMNAYAYGDFVTAVPLAQRAAELDPDGPRAFTVLALLYRDLGDFGQVTRLLDDARKRWPQDGDSVLSVRALLKALQGDLAGAADDAERLLAADHRDWTGLLILGASDGRIGQHGRARDRYANAYPELLTKPPKVDFSNWYIATDLAYFLRESGNETAAMTLLKHGEAFVRGIPRMGAYGFGVADARIHALRGEKTEALAALREAQRSGWRGQEWRFHRDVDLSFSSLRDDPEFKAVFAEIERDMARQRAALAARQETVPLNLR